MPRLVTLGLLALLLTPSLSAQQVTGLAGWELFLDPGHSQTENQGIYGYSEAEKTLRVSLALRDMLLERTDIDTVYTSRTSDTQQVSLSQRTDRANALAADFYHSIHSNAGAPSTNNILMLYGGWRLNGETIEKTPNGGARMGDEYVDAQVEAMRLPTIGNYADRTFYQGFPDTHDRQYPYLFVNRTSSMASVLSESGFHTNPRQNTLNMNADWKRLEAQSFYWGILDWHGVPRSTHRIATGIVTDVESGRPINGATVTVDGQTYTTDTYESLFNRYSDDPDELANGFYYLEDVSAGTHTVTVEAEGYDAATAEVTMRDTTFTFADVALVSNVPPVVTESRPTADQDGFPITDPIRLTFSRPLDPETAGPAFSLAPTAGGDPVAGEVSFEDAGYTLVFRPDAALAARTDYTLTLAASATTVNGSALDGDGDGTAGDDFVLTFISSFPDVAAPRLVSGDPAPNSRDAELRPVVTVAFDEVVVPESLDGRVTLETITGEPIPGTVTVALAGVVGEAPNPQTTVSFAPDADLAPDVSYRFAIEPGVADAFGNASASRYAFTFRTGTDPSVAVLLEDFEGTAVADNWWVPQQSGSTTGIVTDSTAVAASPMAYPLGGDTSMRIDFGWNDSAETKLIRECFGGCSPGHSFTDEATLRIRVFGDGTGVLFRFAVDDGTSGIEVSPWTAVDWYGWQTVSWDLDADGFGSWIGNEAWDSPASLRMESLQLGYDGESAPFGAILVDDLAYLRPPAVAAEGDPAAEALRVEPIWPNPAQTAATVRVSLGEAAPVTAEVFNSIGQRVAVLLDGEDRAAGVHDLALDAGRLAAGAYIVRVTAGARQTTTTFVVAR